MTEANRRARLFRDPGDAMAQSMSPFHRREVDVQLIENGLWQNAGISFAPARDLQPRDPSLVPIGPCHTQLVASEPAQRQISAEKSTARPEERREGNACVGTHRCGGEERNKKKK